MKYLKIFSLIVLISIATVLSNKLKAPPKALRTNLETLAKLRQQNGVFNPNKVTKYFKDQAPPTDKTALFTDTVFPANSNSIEGKDSAGNVIDPTVDISKARNLMGYDATTGLTKPPEWKRATQIFSGKTIYVFKDQIEPKDVKQKEIGDCYFISAIAALTEYPHLVYQLFRTTTFSNTGYYEVVLFIDGEWQVVILDDFFVVKPGTNTIKFAAPNGEELWVMLLEKAWAKVNQGYAYIVGGQDKDSYYSLTGFTTDTYVHSKTTVDELWNAISTADSRGELLAGSTPPGSTTEEEITNGIVLGHAYTLVGSATFNHNNAPVRLVKLRNPWGRHEWNGDWSDSSPLWTPESKTTAGFAEAIEDGIFYMTVEDYLKQYNNTEICHVIHGGHVKSFKVDIGTTFAPQVYNFVANEDTSLNFDVFVKHPRFNRGQGNDPDKVTTFTIGKYENGVVTYLNSDCSKDEYSDKFMQLTKGNYVIWVYNSYFRLTSAKPAHYVVRFVTKTNNVHISFVGVDTDANLIKKLANSAIIQNPNTIYSAGVSIDKNSTLLKTCLGYNRYFLPQTATAPVKVNISTNKNTNMFHLPPYSNNPDAVISFNLQPGKSFVALGVRASLSGSYLYSLSSSFGGSKFVAAVESKVTFVDDINISSFLKSATDLGVYTADYVTTTSQNAESAKARKNTSVANK